MKLLIIFLLTLVLNVNAQSNYEITKAKNQSYDTVTNSEEFNHYFPTKVMRRWNLDPKKKPGLSQYSTFDNNPISNFDYNGKEAFHYMLVYSTNDRPVLFQIQSIRGVYLNIQQGLLDMLNLNKDIYVIHNSKGSFVAGSNFEDMKNKFNTNETIDANFNIDQLIKDKIQSKSYRKNLPTRFDGPGQFVTKDWTDMDRKTNAWWNYQGKINGISGGVEYLYNDVRFDGYKDGILLEAKGFHQFLFTNGITTRDIVYGKMFDQLDKEIKAAGGIPLQWHFTEERTMNEFKEYVKKEEPKLLENVEFINTPPGNKK